MLELILIILISTFSRLVVYNFTKIKAYRVGSFLGLPLPISTAIFTQIEISTIAITFIRGLISLPNSIFCLLSWLLLLIFRMLNVKFGNLGVIFFGFHLFVLKACCQAGDALVLIKVLLCRETHRCFRLFNRFIVYLIRRFQYSVRVKVLSATRIISLIMSTPHIEFVL